MQTITILLRQLNQSDAIILYIGGSLIGLMILYFLVQFATKTERKTLNQRAIIQLLEKLCEKSGVTVEEIEAIQKENHIK